MGKLKTLTLPLGSNSNRLTLTQTQVDTLIKVYYDEDITSKNVSGYVYKESISQREYWLLTQLGLDVSYQTLNSDVWTWSADNSVLTDGQSAAFTVGGELSAEDVVTEISGISVSGGASVAQVAAMLTFDGTTLTFDKGGQLLEFSADVTVAAHPRWSAQDVKSVTLRLTGEFRTVVINPANLSTQLESSGDMALLNDYISRCKCYVFNAAGTKKAEIKSATFSGAYSGMTAGTVTFADDTTVNVSALNSAGCNFMVLRPAMNIFCGTDDGKEVLKNYGIYEVGICKTFPKKYIGMFKAFNQSGVLKSQPNRIPTGTQTIATFMLQAKNGGNDYGLWSYADWQKENALHLSYFADTNYEVNLGTGRIGGDANAYNRVRNIVTGFTLPLAGQYKCGKVATPDSAGNAVNCLNFFGIEGLGEQIWEFVTGFRHDGTTAYIWEDNTWDETHAADRTFALQVTNASQSYIKTIIGGSHFDMLPRAVNGSATTGMCDGHWVQSSGRLLVVGGDAYDGSLCGLSCSAADLAFSYSNARVGARLAFVGEPDTVPGSELLT